MDMGDRRRGGKPEERKSFEKQAKKRGKCDVENLQQEEPKRKTKIVWCELRRREA